MPSATVPTVDIRLVFAAGTADESVDKRGVALVCGVRARLRICATSTTFAFAALAARRTSTSGTDHTTFSAAASTCTSTVCSPGCAAGCAMATTTTAPTRCSTPCAPRPSRRDSGALTDAWRTALYGAGHPYVAAGLVRDIARAVTSDDAAAFRAAHYTPDNATLVISGHFDAALANRWIDYLFADWRGHAVARTAPRAAPTPAALATIEDTAQVGLSIAIPAAAGTRETRLVAAAMLAEIADDVRHQLGASYGLDARLDDQRLASNYIITGSVDAARAGDALQLLRDRIELLRGNPAAAASAFVGARRHVVAQLDSFAGGERPRGTRAA